MKIVRVEVRGPTSRDFGVMLENGEWLEGLVAVKFDTDEHSDSRRIVVRIDVAVLPSEPAPPTTR